MSKFGGNFTSLFLEFFFLFSRYFSRNRRDFEKHLPPLHDIFLLFEPIYELFSDIRIRVRWRDKNSSKNKNKHFEVNDSTANPNGLGNASNSCRTLLPFALASEHLENFNCFSSASTWRNRLIMMKLEGAAPVFRWGSASIPMTFLTAPQLRRKCFAVTKRARAEQLKIFSRNNGNWFGESNIVESRKKRNIRAIFLTFSCKSFFKRWRLSPHGDEDEERIFYAN